MPPELCKQIQSWLERFDSGEHDREELCEEADEIFETMELLGCPCLHGECEH